MSSDDPPLVAVKAILSLLLIAAGAGYLFHDRVQTFLHLPRAGSEEVYYLRAAHQTTNPDGTVVRWHPGQPLHVTAQARAAEGAVALTDGTNVLQVPQNALTRDANEAATLRQTNLVSENTARMQAEQQAARQANREFAADSQISYPYPPGGVVTSSAPVYYCPVPVYVAPAAPPNAPVRNRPVATNNNNQVPSMPPPRPGHRDGVPRPNPTPGH